MTVSEFIVDFLIQKGVKDIFGYPGGMVTNFIDVLSKNSDKISTHITMHEQAASFAACGYAQCNDNLGVAFATSGPGATNLITGIANAYFDSIPSIFITGNINTFETKKELNLRQSGFQETDIVRIVKPITKKAFYVSNANNILKVLEEAFYEAKTGRKGPVLIDVPMNIFRTEIDCNNFEHYENNTVKNEKEIARYRQEMIKALNETKRPCILLGNGIKIDNKVKVIRDILRSCPMPVVSSMISCDIIPEGQGLEGVYYGFIGAYGNRTANFVVAKSDLVICIGSRLSIRQVGAKRVNFAPNAKIIRIDIDKNELENRIRPNDIGFNISIEDAMDVLNELFNKGNSYESWLNVCKEIKKCIKYIDEKLPNKIINSISYKVPDMYNIISDVGQHMVWVAQSFKFKPNQKAFFSGGLGSMGYAIPASIGAYYGTKKPVVCFVGDGGLQMSIEELQFIKHNNLPIKIIVINNFALGMIRHFQEMYYESNFCFTLNDSGYSVPDFCKVASAYGINSYVVKGLEEIDRISFDNIKPELIEVQIKENTYVCPKLEYGKPNQDQEPLLDRELYNYLMKL